MNLLYHVAIPDFVTTKNQLFFHLFYYSKKIKHLTEIKLFNFAFYHNIFCKLAFWHGERHKSAAQDGPK